MVLTEEQQKLITGNYGLLRGFINQILSNHEIPRHLSDEFVSLMYWRFCISALKYDEELGFKFSTYAYGGFRLALKEIRKKPSCEKYKVKVFHFTPKDYADYREDIKDLIRKEFLDDFIESADLIDRERDMLIDYYYDGLVFSEIAKKYNLSRERIRQIVGDGIFKLKRRATGRNLGIEDFL